MEANNLLGSEDAYNHNYNNYQNINKNSEDEPNPKITRLRYINHTYKIDIRV